MFSYTASLLRIVLSMIQDHLLYPVPAIISLGPSDEEENTDDEDTDDEGADEDDDEDSSDDEESEDDTSDEEDTNEDDDTSDDEEEDEEGSDDDNLEDDDDEENDLLKQYRDPKTRKSMDPKLRAATKKLLGSYTKGMQSISEIKATIAALKKDSEFIEWAKDRQKRILKGEAPDIGQKGKFKKSSSKNGKGEKQLSRTEVQKMLKEERDKDRNERMQAEQDRKTRIEFKKFKRDTPDWKTYRKPMVKLLRQNPKLSFNHAYKLARSEAKSGERTVREKRLANINRPTNKLSILKNPTKPSKKKMTVFDAANMAEEELSGRD